MQNLETVKYAQIQQNQNLNANTRVDRKWKWATIFLGIVTLILSVLLISSYVRTANVQNNPDPGSTAQYILDESFILSYNDSVVLQSCNAVIVIDAKLYIGQAHQRGSNQTFALITIWDRHTGSYIDSWDNGELSRVSGFAFEPNDRMFYIVDQLNNLIYKYDEDGNMLLRSADFGLDGPDDIAIDSRGNILISDDKDGGNHRIVWLSADLEFLGEFGEYGSGEGQLVNPHGVATDDNGRIWVADVGNHRLQIFGSDGHHLAFYHCGIDTDISGLRIDLELGLVLITTLDLTGRMAGTLQTIEYPGPEILDGQCEYHVYYSGVSDKIHGVATAANGDAFTTISQNPMCIQRFVYQN